MARLGQFFTMSRSLAGTLAMNMRPEILGQGNATARSNRNL
jgi:hypothetical protein